MLEAAAMKIKLILTAAAALLIGPPMASAQQTRGFALTMPGASAWEVVKGGRVRLVTAPAGPDGSATAALEIELEPGFKTYWWNPGEDGIAPQIGFFGSANVGEAKLTLPPPHVFRETSVTVGYKGQVSFPVEVQLADPAKPYRLVAGGVVGFCADICVPVPFRLQATPPPQATASALEASSVQQVVEPSEGLKIEAAHYDRQNNRLDVIATVPDTDVLLEMVVANPDDLILPPAAETVHQQGDKATFAFQLKQDTPIAEGQRLTFTLVVARFGQAGRIGIEQDVPVAFVE